MGEEEAVEMIGISSPARYTVILRLPPKQASPNYHPSTIKEQIKAKQIRGDYRRECAQKLRDARIPALAAATIHLEFYLWQGSNPTEKYSRMGYYFPMDASNALAAFKQGQDSLIDAHVIPNDDSRHLSIGRITLHRHKDTNERRTELVLTIEEGL